VIGSSLFRQVLKEVIKTSFHFAFESASAFHLFLEDILNVSVNGTSR